MMNVIKQEEFARLTKETMNNSMNFFRTVNETIFGKTTEERPVHPFANNVEMITKVSDEYQKNHQQLMNRIEQFCRETFSNTTKNLNTPTDPKFDPQQITRFNIDLMDQTLKFFNQTNESIWNLSQVTPPTNSPKNFVDTIYKSCEEYTKTYKNLTGSFEKFCHTNLGLKTPTPKPEQNKTETVQPTTPFDPRNVMRLNDQMIENTVKFFMTMNENVLHITDEKTRTTMQKNLEILNKNFHDYQNMNRDITTRIEDTCRQTLNTLIQRPTDSKAEPRTTPVDQLEMIRLNHEIITNTIRFFLNLHTNLHQMREDHNRDEKKTPLTEWNKLAETYTNAHHILFTRLTTIMNEAIHPVRNTQTQTVQNARTAEKGQTTPTQEPITEQPTNKTTPRTAKRTTTSKTRANK